MQTSNCFLHGFLTLFLRLVCRGKSPYLSKLANVYVGLFAVRPASARQRCKKVLLPFRGGFHNSSNRGGRQVGLEQVRVCAKLESASKVTWVWVGVSTNAADRQTVQASNPWLLLAAIHMRASMLCYWFLKSKLDNLGS